MEVFESKPPEYSQEILSEIAADYFSKSGIIKPLVSERDQNARLITEEGDYVLKIANSAEDPEFLEFQNASEALQILQNYLIFQLIHPA